MRTALPLMVFLVLVVHAGAQAPLTAASPEAAIVPTGFGEKVDRDVERVRKATEKFKDLDRAVAAGYAREVPHCIANPPQGAMGFHHGNGALFDDISRSTSRKFSFTVARPAAITS